MTEQAADEIATANNIRTPLEGAGALPTKSPTMRSRGVPLVAWQPIETAPKDGTFILACQRPDEGPCWFKSWEQWKAPQTIAWRGFHPNAPGKAQWRDAKGSPVTPDLWMPLTGLAVQP